MRVQKGFNQMYLAQLSNTTEDSISLVERGINAPSFETLEALASALEIDAPPRFSRFQANRTAKNGFGCPARDKPQWAEPS